MHHQVRVTMHEVLFVVWAYMEVATFEVYSTVSQAGSASLKDSPVDLQKMRIHLDGLGQARVDLLKLQVGPERARLQALQTLQSVHRLHMVQLTNHLMCHRILMHYLASDKRPTDEVRCLPSVIETPMRQDDRCRGHLKQEFYRALLLIP